MIDKKINMKSISKRFIFTPTIYDKGIILGFRRSLRHQKMSQVRISIPVKNKIQNNRKYIGKKIFYYTKDRLDGKKTIRWGKIFSQHGKKGVFLAKFKKQISPSMIMSPVFITFLPYSNEIINLN